MKVAVYCRVGNAEQLNDGSHKEGEKTMQTIKDLCVQFGMSQSALARRFNIPLRTLQDWYSERRTPPAYVVEMMAQLLEIDRQKENEQ